MVLDSRVSGSISHGPTVCCWVPAPSPTWPRCPGRPRVVGPPLSSSFSGCPCFSMTWTALGVHRGPHPAVGFGRWRPHGGHPLVLTGSEAHSSAGSCPRRKERGSGAWEKGLFLSLRTVSHRGRWEVPAEQAVVRSPAWAPCSAGRFGACVPRLPAGLPKFQPFLAPWSGPVTALVPAGHLRAHFSAIS